MSKKSKWQEVGESGHVKVLFVKSLNLTKLQAIKKKERKKKKKAFGMFGAKAGYDLARFLKHPSAAGWTMVCRGKWRGKLGAWCKSQRSIMMS
jgi:hypothetical protein